MTEMMRTGVYVIALTKPFCRIGEVNMENREFFEQLLCKLQLGFLTAQPQRVSGGYLHRMYKLETTTGEYAVKLLNPVIMKRPDAMSNYQRAEQLERVLCEHKIPAVQALEINGRKMHCVNGQYLYVFQWINGRVLDWNDIKKEHCEIAGGLLAKIHQIECIQKHLREEKVNINWDEYIRLAHTECPEIVDELKSNRELLYSAQKDFNAAMESVPDITCISDGDMDSKNVLWLDEKPLIIDLESLDYGNPFLEMFQLALSWSGGVLCSMDYDRLKAFVAAYQREYGVLGVDWMALSGAGFCWLNWLEYNVKRAVMIECGNEEERRLGIGEVHKTIQRIIYYASVRDDVVKNLSAVH